MTKVEISQKKISSFLTSDRKTIKGLEKENLRSDPEGKISNNPFPDAFGVHNFNSFVTLDYSEPHLEIVTPTFEDNQELFGFLKHLHGYVESNLGEDLLWNYSMPPRFKRKYIKLPPHRDVNSTKLAHLYRLGLRNRYGDKMQSTAGIHFNISFSESVINSLSESKTDIYLGACRNFLRIFPLVLRLIGCSPVTHKSFVKDRNLNIDKLNPEDCYLPKSTSLRVSRLGYYSEEQDENFITFNSLKEYLDTIKNYINTPNEKFSNISLDLKQQVNNGTIQMESELYNHIRPKGEFSKTERQYNQLKKTGIEYLEIRSIDLNPYSEIGISIEDVEFLELLSLFCSLSDSPKIDEAEAMLIKENIRRASEVGQDCTLLNSFDTEKGETNIKELTNTLLEDLKSFAKKIELESQLDNMFIEYFSRNENPLSTRLLNDLASDEILNYVLSKSKKIKDKVPDSVLDLFKKESELSEKEYLKAKNRDNIDFQTFIKEFREEIK